MFADRARILVAAGSGGDGAATFRREAHVPRGGPDDGDGGNGGSVVLAFDAGMTTLGDFKRKRHFRAAPGGRGMGRRGGGQREFLIMTGWAPLGAQVFLSQGLRGLAGSGGWQYTMGRCFISPVVSSWYATISNVYG